MDAEPLLGHVAPVAVDHRRRPASKTGTGRWPAALFIIAVEVSERFALAGIASNLFIYLTGQFQESTAAAAAAVNAWSGVSTLLPLVGAFIADSYLGRYRAIIIASIIYCLGLAMLTLSALLPTIHPPKCSNTTACPPDQYQVAIFYLSLYLIAVAQGGHKPCVQAFGADQFDENDPNEFKSRSSFFNWWYFTLCGSVGISTFSMSYVQDNISWSLGFGIPCMVMGLGLIVFLLGTRKYRYYLVQNENPYTRICKTLWANCVSASEVDEEAKGLLQLLPLWETCLMYAIVFAQSSTFFIKQGSTLDRRISTSFQIPSAALQSFVSLTIVIFVPVYDRTLVPIARMFTGSPSGLTTLQRIGAGIALSIITMVIAALVEMKRLRIAREFGLVDQPMATIPMSFWWLIPQYIIFGMTNVFTLVGMQEFFYDQVPDAMRSLGLALYLSILGIGSLMSGFLVFVIEKATKWGGDNWFSDNLNRAHLDYFYWLLAGLSSIGFVVYLYFAQSYVYKKKGNVT